MDEININNFSNRVYGDKLKLPFRRSYFVVPEKLMAGCYPSSIKKDKAHRKLKALVSCGVRHVINLMEKDEIDHSGKLFQDYEDVMRSIAKKGGCKVSFKRMPIRDMWIPSREEMKGILDQIDQAIAKGKPVYVHCWGGRGRTGTVVGCYLVRHGYAKGKKVLNMINDLRKDVEDAHLPSPETKEQISFILSWSESE